MSNKKIRIKFTTQRPMRVYPGFDVTAIDDNPNIEKVDDYSFILNTTEKEWFWKSMTIRHQPDNVTVEILEDEQGTVLEKVA